MTTDQIERLENELILALRDLAEEVKERERLEEMCDLLAGKIAHLEGLNIGEHSNLNDPWRNALDGDNAEYT